MVHVQQAFNVIMQKVLLTACEKECTYKLSKDNKALVSFMGEEVNPPIAKAILKATDASTCMNKAVALIINQVFQLHSDLLLE